MNTLEDKITSELLRIVNQYNVDLVKSTIKNRYILDHYPQIEYVTIVTGAEGDIVHVEVQSTLGLVTHKPQEMKFEVGIENLEETLLQLEAFLPMDTVEDVLARLFPKERVKDRYGLHFTLENYPTAGYITQTSDLSNYLQVSVRKMDRNELEYPATYAIPHEGVPIYKVAEHFKMLTNLLESIYDEQVKK